MLNHEKLYKRLVFERIPFWDFLNELFSLPRDNETVIELKKSKYQLTITEFNGSKDVLFMLKDITKLKEF